MTTRASLMDEAYDGRARERVLNPLWRLAAIWEPVLQKCRWPTYIPSGCNGYSPHGCRISERQRRLVVDDVAGRSRKFGQIHSTLVVYGKALITCFTPPSLKHWGMG